MENETINTFDNKESYVESAQAQMEKWREGLEKLFDETKEFPSEVQAAYRKRIGDLREQLEEVESVFDEMNEADREHWDEASYHWGTAAAQYWHAFSDTTKEIEDKHSIPLGWVQGLTDKRTYESAGWAEGFGHRPEGSEGWAEGMAKQESGSRGWSEGYDSQS